MTDLSLYILDITMNSVRAGAKNIEVKLEEIRKEKDAAVQSQEFEKFLLFHLVG